MISELSDKASRELSLQNTLTKMQGEWDNTKFFMVKYKETNTYVLKNTQPIWEGATPVSPASVAIPAIPASSRIFPHPPASSRINKIWCF